jgi:hypothetical protein
MTMFIAVNRVKRSRELAVVKAAANNWRGRHAAVWNSALVDAVHNRARNHIGRRNLRFGLRRDLPARLPLRAHHAAAKQHHERKPE